jgi:NifU-like protein involved in Fe-S cluster formation
VSAPYSAIVMDHFHAPRNARRMERPDRVGTAGTPARGPFLVLYLRLVGQRIEEASFQTYGCAPAIAAGSLLAERLPGVTLAEARAWTAPAIEAALGGLPRHKRVCAELAAQALALALGPAVAPTDGETPSPGLRAEGDRRAPPEAAP